MAWELIFYRRVGQPVLHVEELDTALATRPGFSRETSEDDEPDTATSVLYRCVDASGGEFAFTFEPPEDDPEAQRGRADFPYEETGLHLYVPFLQDEAVVDRALRTVSELAGELSLLTLDPQIEQEEPVVPEQEVLARSYAARSTEVTEMIQYLRDRRKRLLATALAMLVAGLVLMLLLVSGLLGPRDRPNRERNSLQPERIDAPGAGAHQHAQRHRFRLAA